MEWLAQCFDFFIHLDHHIDQIIAQYGAWTYFIVFLIIFCETGLVVTPFLPGDSLLFVLGAMAAIGSLNLWFLIVLLCIAAILGDSVNYWIGHILAPKITSHQKIKFIKQEYIDRTQKFYEKYGGKTLIIARFVPIIRTFAPFLAGVGKMHYGRFLFYNIVGGLLWIFIFVLGGFFFGNLPFIKKNFTLAIFAIIIISIIPAIIEILKHRKNQ